MSAAPSKTELLSKEIGVKQGLFDQCMPLSAQLPIPQPIAATLDKAGVISLELDAAPANQDKQMAYIESNKLISVFNDGHNLSSNVTQH